jgi:hypothetical protein
MQCVRVFSLLGCIAAGLAANAQSGQPISSVPPMRQIYVQDQRDRGVLLSDTGESVPPSDKQKQPVSLDDKTMNANDAKRRNQVRSMLAAGQVSTAQDFHDAAFVFQHGQTADDYLLAHILAVEAVVKGDASSKWISAATLDRYLQTIGQQQVFGTQYGNRTQQPYDGTLIPDALRLDFCVPQLSQQKVNLQEFNEGRYPKGIIPEGCTR